MLMTAMFCFVESRINTNTRTYSHPGGRPQLNVVCCCLPAWLCSGALALYTHGQAKPSQAKPRLGLA